MQFPVEVGKELRMAEVGFAREPDVEVIRSWAAVPWSGDQPLVEDAAEYAGLAAAKWSLGKEKGRVAQTLGDLLGAIKADAEAELITLLVAHAGWPHPAGPLGFCLVRRTWAHNLRLFQNSPR